MTKDRAIELLNIYGEAWEQKNPNLIPTIFTDNATYNDPKEPKNIGIEAIRKYWEYKVVGEQDNIKFNLLNVWLDTDTVIAEWHATFDDTKRNLAIDMLEVALFTIQDDKFSSLREYYKTEKRTI